MTYPTPANSIDELPPAPNLGGLDPDPWLTPIGDLIGELVHRLRVGGPNAEAAIPTGIEAFDGADGGLAPGTLTAVCAWPKGDRTTPLLAAALHAAEHEYPVVVYALDLTVSSLAVRIAALVTGIPELRLRAGTPTETDLAELSDLHKRLALPLDLVAGQAVGSHDIRAAIFSADDKPELIVVDNYPLLLHGARARDLKHLAVDLNVAVLCSTTLHGPSALELWDLDTDLLSAADTITSAVGADTLDVLLARYPPLPRLKSVGPDTA